MAAGRFFLTTSSSTRCNRHGGRQVAEFAQGIISGIVGCQRIAEADHELEAVRMLDEDGRSNARKPNQIEWSTALEGYVC